MSTDLPPFTGSSFIRGIRTGPSRISEISEGGYLVDSVTDTKSHRNYVPLSVFFTG